MNPPPAVRVEQPNRRTTELTSAAPALVADPSNHYGPDFTEAREFYAAQTYSPSTTFSHNWVAFAGDFTGDGWPDVLLASTDNNRLYVNPKGEARRWDMFPDIIPPANSRSCRC